MRRCFTDPHYWKNPALRRSREKARKQNDKTQLFATTPPLGCAILFFFGFLCFWFLVFWFVVAVFEGWQNNTKVKDLDLTLCQFSHFRGCKLAFGCFIVCNGPVVPLENNIKTMTKWRCHRGKLGGLGTQVRQFCMFM